MGIGNDAVGDCAQPRRFAAAATTVLAAAAAVGKPLGDD